MKTILGIIVLGLAQAANASTVECTDYSGGGKVVYTNHRSDGGPHSAPTIKLVLHGKVLIDRDTQAILNSEADIVFEDEKTLLKSKSTDGDYELSATVARAVVRELPLDLKSALVFEGLVRCERSVFIGTPRP